MKKIILNIVLLLLTTFYISCNKDKEEIPFDSPSSAVSIENGELKFSSIEDYENMLENGDLTSNKLTTNLGSLYSSFTSLHSKIKKSELSDVSKQAYFGLEAEEESPILNILNDKEMVTIGNWTLMIDMVNEVIGVVDIDNQYLKSLLKSKDFRNSNILWFGTEDDVLLLLEEGKKGTLTSNDIEKRVKSAKKRSENPFSKASTICSLNTRLDNTTNILKDKKIIISQASCGTGQTTTIYIPIYDSQGNITGYRPEQVTDCDKWIADAKHVYQKAGIYFSLQSKIKYRGNVNCNSAFPSAVKTRLTANVRYSYERRRRFKKNEKKSGTKNDSKYTNEVNIRSYEGSRSLKKYELNTTFTYERKDDCYQFCSVPNKTVTIKMPQIKK